MTPSDKKQDSKDVLRDSLRSKLRDDSHDPDKAQAPKSDAETRPGARSGGFSQSVPPPGGSQQPKRPGDMLRTSIVIGTPGLARMTAFCRQLATLVDVGIPLVQSLTILSERIEHPKLKRVVGDVARRVEEGGSFSESLAAHPKIFSSLVVNVVRIGETGGILEGSLKYLAEVMERRYELRRRVSAGARQLETWRCLEPSRRRALLCIVSPNSIFRELVGELGVFFLCRVAVVYRGVVVVDDPEHCLGDCDECSQGEFQEFEVHGLGLPFVRLSHSRLVAGSWLIHMQFAS